jgi:hypothetical protein
VTFRVFLSEKAQQDLDSLPAKIEDQILADCKRLADDPLPVRKRCQASFFVNQSPFYPFQSLRGWKNWGQSQVTRVVRTV